MKKLLKTVYVSNPDAYLRLEGETLVIAADTKELAQIPLHNLCGIVCFGYKGASPALMGTCAERGIDLCFLTPHGRFLARIAGPVRGNVLLRKTQILLAEDEEKSMEPARAFVKAKIYNCRWSLERVLRDHGMRIDEAAVTGAIGQHKTCLAMVDGAGNIGELMGIEGIAAKAYFSVFDQMILRNGEAFRFAERTRRPPTDRTNALLSFVYTLLAGEICSALECAGLDPYVGFLHQKRPGRCSLALDILEELRAPLADRFVLSQINLGAVLPNDFDEKENGAVFLKDDARRKFLAAWQERKYEEIKHPFLGEKVEWGLVAYVQALLLSRWMRGDLDTYPPFFWK